ncbi:MAG: hypothetical protein U0U66_03100 [Cytophagaceae bacterium]
MNKSRIIAIIIGAAILLTVAYYLTHRKFENKTDWSQYTQDEKVEPFATTLVKSMIENRFGNRINYITKPIRQQLPKSNIIPQNYLYIGSRYNINPLDAKALLDYAAHGNTVFISAHEYQHILFDSIVKRHWEHLGSYVYIESSYIGEDVDVDDEVEIEEYEEEEFIESTDTVPAIAFIEDTNSQVIAYDTVTVDTYTTETPIEEPNYQNTNIYQKSLDQSPIIQMVYDIPKYDIYLSTDSGAFLKVKSNVAPSQYLDDPNHQVFISYWSDSILKIPSVEVFEKVKFVNRKNEKLEKITGIKIPVGKGFIYFHSYPTNFCNYFLKDKEGFTYANEEFKILLDSELWWDEFSKTTPPYYPEYKKEHTTILQYILNNEALRWTWYLLLLMGLLYIIFYGKRRQRSMAVQEVKRNATMDYIYTAGRMFFSNGKHEKIVQLNYRQMLVVLFNKYGISIRDNYTEQTEILAAKTGISVTEWNTFIETGRRYSKPGYEISAADFQKFYLLAQHIYTKIQS